MNIGKLGITAVMASALASFSCVASTTFTSSWKAPDAQQMAVKPGDKVIALVLAKSTSLRHSGEANLADELSRRGFKGVPAYTLITDTDTTDEGKARTAIDATGASALIVLRPMGKQQEISSTPSTYYGGPYYGGFWGGYYGYGWGGAYSPGTIRTDTYVFIETLIYDLHQNKLVWAGQTKTMNPSDVEGFIKELSQAVSERIKAMGVVAAR